MASQGRRQGQRVDDAPTVTDEQHLDFISGFPCTHFHCNGSLRRRDHRGRPAIACSRCNHVYYVLARA